MFGSPGPDAWIPPPLALGAGVQGCATTDLGPPGVGRAKRNREFLAGRRCAGEALRRAGSTELQVGVGPGGRPLWPRGFVGSITHTSTLSWAAVAPRAVRRSIGIDSEPVFDERALGEAAPLALDESERRLAHSHGNEALASTLIFSAKESLFKCVNPCTRIFFEFTDARMISFSLDRGSDAVFELELLRDLTPEFSRGRRFHGRFAIALGHVHTAVELDPSPHADPPAAH